MNMLSTQFAVAARINNDQLDDAVIVVGQREIVRHTNQVAMGSGRRSKAGDESILVESRTSGYPARSAE